jgi:hypothetical protein
MVPVLNFILSKEKLYEKSITSSCIYFGLNKVFFMINAPSMVQVVLRDKFVFSLNKYSLIIEIPVFVRITMVFSSSLIISAISEFIFLII